LIFLIYCNHPNPKTIPKADKYTNNKNKSLKTMFNAFKQLMILSVIIPFLMIGVLSSYGETMSPLEQTKQGVSANEVACREGFVLMVRESGTPTCLTAPSYLRSIDRGWGVGDLDLLQAHPEQLDSVISTIMQNRQLREQVIERISANPEAVEKIKGNEKLMNVLEGKGMVGEGQAGAQMGGMFGSTETGEQMEQMMGNMGFKMGGDSKMGNMIGGMVDKMMGNMANGMENSPSMGAQMRTSDNLMGKLFG